MTPVLLAPLLAHLAAGVAFGLVYFRSLQWNARLWVGGARMRTALMVMIGRFVLLAGVLGLASLEGALPLLAIALGILVGRFIILSRLRAVSP